MIVEIEPVGAASVEIASETADPTALSKSLVPTGPVGPAGEGASISVTDPLTLNDDTVGLDETALVPGSDTEILYNDGGTLGAEAGLTWDAGTLSVQALDGQADPLLSLQDANGASVAEVAVNGTGLFGMGGGAATISHNGAKAELSTTAFGAGSIHIRDTGRIRLYDNTRWHTFEDGRLGVGLSSTPSATITAQAQSGQTAPLFSLQDENGDETGYVTTGGVFKGTSFRVTDDGNWKGIGAISGGFGLIYGGGTNRAYLSNDRFVIKYLGNRHGFFGGKLGINTNSPTATITAKAKSGQTDPLLSLQDENGTPQFWVDLTNSDPRLTWPGAADRYLQLNGSSLRLSTPNGLRLIHPSGGFWFKGGINSVGFKPASGGNAIEIYSQNKVVANTTRRYEFSVGEVPGADVENGQNLGVYGTGDRDLFGVYLNNDKIVAIDERGYMGVGTNDPTATITAKAKSGQTDPLLSLRDSSGNPLITDQIGGDRKYHEPGSGIILTSPDGTVTKRVHLDNSGNITTTTV